MTLHLTEGRGGSLVLSLLTFASIVLLILHWDDCPSAPLNIWLLVLICVLIMNTIICESFRDFEIRAVLFHGQVSTLNTHGIDLTRRCPERSSVEDGLHIEEEAVGCDLFEELHGLTNRLQARTFGAFKMPLWAYGTVITTQIFLSVWFVYGTVLYMQSRESCATLLHNYVLFIILCAFSSYFLLICYSIIHACISMPDFEMQNVQGRDRRYSVNSEPGRE